MPGHGIDLAVRHHQPAQAAGCGRGLNKTLGRAGLGQVRGHDVNLAAAAAVLSVVLAAPISQALVARRPVAQDQIPSIIRKPEREASTDGPPPADTSHQHRSAISARHGSLRQLRGAGFILRSRAPELVCQELFAFLTVYQALCALEAEAARQAGIDPDRISFTVTVRVARDHAASHAIITPRSLDLARRQAISDLLGDILPRRRDRQYERVRKQPKNNFPAMKRGHERPPSGVTYKIKVTRKASSPAGTP